MKPSKVILWSSVGLIVSVAFGAWTTYDYGLRCTKCLAGKDVVEERLFGITVSRRTKDGNAAADYERIFGHSCEHVFRRGGFGRGMHCLFGSAVACGITNEGIFARPRLDVVSATYDAEKRLHDRELALATFQIIDSLMPPDAQVQHRRSFSDTTKSTIFLLGDFLHRARTVEQWRAILGAAHQNFSDKSNLPTK